MDKKDFIFPGVILGLVIIIGLGLLLTHAEKPTLIPSGSIASSTATSSEQASSSETKPGSGASASAPHAPSAYYPYGSVTLSLNQAAAFKDGVSVRPLTVLEDSRCPADVECIQAGTLKLSLKIDAGGAARAESLQIGQSVIAGNDTVTLESVTPTRTSSGTITATAYRFTFTVAPRAALGQCFVGGCSRELCTDSPNAVSSCIYSSKYACYRTATCERQASGACGWTDTPALSACLANPPG